MILVIELLRICTEQVGGGVMTELCWGRAVPRMRKRAVVPVAAVKSSMAPPCSTRARVEIV